MRKLFFFLFVLVLAHGFIPLIHAQTTSVQNKMMQPSALPMPARRLPSIFGQDHFYTVSLRGNGEAVVASRIIFSNVSEKATDTLVLRVPKVEPKDIIAFQLLREKSCLRYQPNKPTDAADTRICMDYQDVDFRT